EREDDSNEGKKKAGPQPGTPSDSSSPPHGFPFRSSLDRGVRRARVAPRLITSWPWLFTACVRKCPEPREASQEDRSCTELSRARAAIGNGGTPCRSRTDASPRAPGPVEGGRA